ncbi:TPA: spermidine synthase [Pseudomonas aeruginosa]|nr:spermidine synthase [Pseudomonas aeruginosa]HBN8975625.1 spermidine synthase [Pseudomonas aeruginosa]
MDTPIERAPLAPDLSQARYAVDLTGLVPAEVAAGLPPLPPNHFYFYPPDPLLEGDGAITAIEDSDPFDQYVYRLRRVLYQGRTRWQNVLIADTYNYDRVLMLDGAIQSAESDESLYHELLVQPAMLAHDEPRDVLIIGGGEGATLREVLSHASVRRAVMVDLDRELVELCREHLFQWHQGAFDDPRSELLTEDGRAYLERDPCSTTWSSSMSSTCSTTARPRLSIPASSTNCCTRACVRAG